MTIRHWFSPPVRVRDVRNVGATYGVASVEAAIEQMQTWPIKGMPKPKMRRAYEVCYGVADGSFTPEQARAAFEAAAKEAKVLRGGGTEP